MKTKPLTIVMYHYVRDLKNTAYPEIKGLDTQLFQGQCDYLAHHHHVITPFEFLHTCRQPDVELPENAALLTFDDGYKDHIDTVFPILIERGWSGIFFPPSKVIYERCILDVNKIHYILASEPNVAVLVDRLEALARDEISDFKAYREQYYHANRFDPAEVIYFKRMLQHALPKACRERISDQLFAEFVTRDTKAFADELYLNEQDCREMQDAGMLIGSHGHAHDWLNQLTDEAQFDDIQVSLSLLNALEIPKSHWTFCFPYGAYNDMTLSHLKHCGFQAALTTEVSVADLLQHDPLCLPRLDTNDLPKILT